jgi:hypothetical protein
LDAKKEQYEFTIPLQEGVSNVLSANANIAITDFEVLMGQVNFTAEVCLNVIYALEDGTMSNYQNCETINGKMEDLGLDPNTLVKILPNMINIEIEKGQGSALRLLLNVEYELNILKNQEINVFSNTDENIFVKESEMEISKFICRNCNNFSQNTIFDTKIPVRQVLSVNSTAIVTKADALDGVVIVEGEFVTRTLYSTEDDRPVLVSLTNRENFREEIADNRSTQNMMVEAYARVMNRGVEEVVNKEEKTIEVKVPIRICYDLFQTSTMNVIADAYSTKNEINLTTEAFLSNQVNGYEVVENKIDGSVSLDEGALRIDKILGVDGAY